MHDTKTGWLGYDAEKIAWGRARNELGEGFRLYKEFSEFPTKVLRELQAKFEKRDYTWYIERRLRAQSLLPYELIPTYTQDTGNCVAAGIAGAGQKLTILEIGIGGEEQTYREWYIPWIYAISRNQIGSGLNGAGSTGIWGARAVNEYGVLFSDDIGVPPTTGYSDAWGHRRNAGRISDAQYGLLADIASDNRLEVIRCTDVEQMVECMDAGMQLTIASYQGFRVKEWKGLHIYEPRGRWAHQMHLTDIRREPTLMFYRMNQWGPGHATPLNEETPGGAWNKASDLEREINDKTEVYAYRKFAGEPSGPRYDFI